MQKRKSRLIGVATIIMLAGIAFSQAQAQLANSPWPMAGHDSSFSYRSSSEGIITPTVLWSTTVPWYSWYLSLDSEETIYIGGKGWDNTTATLMALTQSGLKWSQEKKAILWTFTPIPLVGVNFVSFNTAAIGVDDTVFASTSSSPYVSCGFGCSQYCPDCENNTLYAINPDGSIKWQVDIAGSSTHPVIGPDGTVYFATRHGIDRRDYAPCYLERESPEDFLFAYNPGGTQKWAVSLGTYRINGNPAVALDGSIYLTATYIACIDSDPRSGYTRDSKIMAFNPDGTIKWEISLGDMALGRFALAEDGSLYLSYYQYGQYKLLALDTDGATKWEYPAQVSSLALSPDGTIYFSEHSSYWYLNALNPDGTVKWRVRTSDNQNLALLSNLAVDGDGKIYVGDNQGGLYIYSPGGELLAQKPLIIPELPAGSVRFFTIILGKNLVYAYVLPYTLEEYDCDYPPCYEQTYGDAKLFAIGNLYPASNLTATAQADSTIRLDWFISPTPTTAGYNIYLGTNLWDIDYSVPYASVTHPETTYTTAPLEQGQYCFGLRAYDSSGNEEKNTNLVACATIAPTPPCIPLATARIKVPKAGKRLGGNMMTTMAEIIGDRHQVSQVLFEYQSPGASEWSALPYADPNHPNPDLSFPFFIHTEIAGWPEGDYGLRAVATDTNSCADPNPEAIRITIDHHHPDCEEFWDEEGNYQKRCSVYHNAPTELIVAEPFDEQDRIAGLYFPEQSLNQDLSSLTVSFPSCNPFKKGIGECRLVELENGQNVLENGAWATIAISYPDENDDGIVDGTDIKSGHLALFSPTPGSDTWTILPSISDPDQKIIMGLTQHFSEFQLGSKPRVKRPSLSCAMSQESTQAEMDISEAVILLLPMASLLWRLKKRKNN